ncbi:MAG: GNAT family N-acetyltransferase [Oceanospirillum sp.]|nr:GNAT family N-acetyltransferase [Oceanospirillum sp.]
MIYALSDDYYVRPLCRDDLNNSYPLWFQDQDVCRYNSHGTYAYTEQYFERFFDGINGSGNLVWAICHSDDGHIGNIALQNISAVNQSAEFAIILGDRRHWGKGVARLAADRILLHGFNKLNIRRIYCGTADTNEGMKSLARFMKMAEEGRRRQHLFLDGQWVDVVEYGVMRDEYID